MYKKIHIIGGSGSGKSYLAKKLSKELSINHYDLDDVFWDNSDKNYNVRTPEDIRDKKISDILSNDGWIMEGVYYREDWLYRAFDEADLIIILAVNPWVRDFNICKRYIIERLCSKNDKFSSFKNFINLLFWNHKYERKHVLSGFLQDFANKRSCVSFLSADNALKYIVKNNM